MQKIIEAKEHVLAFLREIPLSNNTIKHYKRYLQSSVVAFCEANSIVDFSDDVMQAYAEEQMSKANNGEISVSVMVRHRKAAAMLADCMQGRQLVWEHKVFKGRKLCHQFEKSLNDFETYISQSLAHRTVQRYIGVARQFYAFVEQEKDNDLGKLTSNTIKDFIASVAPKNSASMQNIMGAIKKLTHFLTDNGNATISDEWKLFNPVPRRRKLLPCFTDKEVDAILASIDRSTPVGKRDYAIVMLALWAGFRCVDIVNLKKLDIDWNRNAINVIQQKTKVSIRAELPTKAGNALADYILNGRPETDSPYIFVRHNRPYCRISDSAGRDVMARCLSVAGIYHEAWDGKSFHALRRTFGTRLIRGGTPISFVSEMLGHKNPNSAVHYISLDTDGLRECCLDISMFTAKNGGGLI